MRKITVLLSLVLMASFVWAQNYSQQDREKMLRENEQRMLIDQKARSTFDASPFTPTASTVTAQKATWDILYSWSTSAPAEQAIACNGTNFYTTFWNGAGVFNKYSSTGVFESTFTIATAGGIRDLAYDGQYFYGGASSSTLYQLDLVNQTQISSITATGVTIRHCTYDPTADNGNGGFWIGNWTDLFLVSRTGAILTTGPATLASVYGSAYDDVTPGGPYLWLFAQNGSGELVTIQQFRLSDMTLTGVEKVADDIPGFIPGSIAGGLEAYKDVASGKLVLLGNIQQEPNLVFGYELAIIANPGAPGASTAMAVTPGAAGALTASIAWTNPSLTVNGAALTELTNIKVYRGETLIHTITSPTIGAAETYVDNAVPASGNFTYKVQGENAAGVGLSATASAFVGTDFPAAPGNIVLAASGNNGVITWEAPTTGLNGGYFVPTGLTYNVTRFPGAVAVATGISELTYTDDAVPGIGNYYYAVQAINATGPGGSANSNMVLLGAEGIFFYEPFTTTAVGSLPAGWVAEGAGTTNWAVYGSANAGGEAPELRMSYSPAFNGEFRLSTPDFSIEDYTALKLSFRHMLNNYTSDEGELLGVYASYDAGATWVEIWSSAIGTADIPPTLNEFFLDVPPTKANMRLSWLFTGNSFNIDYYYIDDVIVEPVVDNDLKAISLTGNTAPTAGAASTYSFTIQNAGTVTQDTYTVNLYKEGDVLIQSLPGVSIEFAANHTFEFTWTPEDGDVDNTDYLYANILFAGDEVQGNNQSGQLAVDVQPAGIITVPIGNHTTLPSYRIPFDFFWKNSLSQTIYYPDEMGGVAGLITSISLYNNFSTNVGAKAVKIWLGTTELESLETAWADPSALTLVYDGEVTFPNGANTIMIPLTTPYFHGGGKLVVYTNRVWEDGYFSSSDKFYVTDSPDHPNKTRHVQADGTSATAFDPLAPPAPEAGQLKSAHPDITLFINPDGLGALEGVVTDGTDPIEGAKVTITGTYSISTYTNALGEYEFPYVLAGTYDVTITSHGYIDLLIEDVVIEEELTTTQNATLEAIPTVSVSGIVTGSDAPAVGLEGAIITLTGYEDYNGTTNNLGEFEITGVYADNTYSIEIEYPGFTNYTGEVVVADVNVDLGTITLSEIAFPPSSVTAAVENDNALVTWFAPGNNPVVEFRYDSGVIGGQLGFGSGTATSIMGSCHRRSAQVQQISWQCTSEGGPHNTVNVYVMALDESGNPTSTVLYSAMEVPNTDNTWMVHTLSAPVEAPNGFMLALSYSTGFLGLATDVPDAQYPFLNNTHFYNADYTTGAYSTVESAGFSATFLLRAMGLDYGPAGKGTNPAVARSAKFGEIPVYVANEAPVSAGEPVYASFNKNSKALVGYNTFRLLQGQESDEALWVSLTTNQTDTFYVDTQWETLESEIYKYAVKAVYTNGVLSVPAISNALPKAMTAPVTINITTNGGDAPTGAAVVMTNQDGNPEHVYTASAPANGIVNLPEVWKGTYDLAVNLTGFEAYTEEDILVEDVVELDVELIEIIVTPYNLEVVTDQSNALFSWNNAGNAFFEDFEAFTDFTQDLTPWTTYTSNTSATYGFNGITFPGSADPFAYIIFNPTATTPIVDGMTAYSGERFAASFANTTPPNDSWLISPQVGVDNGAVLSFMVKTFVPDYGLERYNVYVSTTDTQISSFVKISEGTYLEAPAEDWAEVSFDLSDYAGQNIYIAIQCVSNDAFVFMVDDIYVGVPQAKSLTHYKVYLDETEVATTSDLNYTFTGLSNGNHTAGVQAVYSSGSSEIVSTGFVITIGIEEHTAQNLSVFPVPAKSQVNVTSDANILSLRVTDITGRVVFNLDKVDSNNHQFDVTNLNEGIYFVQILTSKGYATRKFQVVK